MEWLATFIIVLIVVLLVGSAFSIGGARGPWPNMLWFFLLLFVGTLAIAAWAQPIGPQPWGAPVLTFFVAAILIALLIAAATPDYRHGYRRTRKSSFERDSSVEPGAEPPANAPLEEEAAGAVAALSVFFWVFLIVAGTVLLLRLLFGPV